MRKRAWGPVIALVFVALGCEPSSNPAHLLGGRAEGRWRPRESADEAVPALDIWITEDFGLYDGQRVPRTVSMTPRVAAKGWMSWGAEAAGFTLEVGADPPVVRLTLDAPIEVPGVMGRPCDRIALWMDAYPNAEDDVLWATPEGGRRVTFRRDG